MKYWIDFSGYVCVEAENVDDAESKFWQEFVPNVSEPFSDDVWDIDGIEKQTGNDFLSTVYGDGKIMESCIYNPTPQELEDFWDNK